MAALLWLLTYGSAMERLLTAGAELPNLSVIHAVHAVYAAGDSLVWEIENDNIRVLAGSPSLATLHTPVDFYFYRRPSPYFPHPLFAPDAYRCEFVADTVYFRKKGVEGKARPPDYFEVRYGGQELVQRYQRHDETWTIATRYRSAVCEYRGTARAVETPPPLVRRVFDDVIDGRLQVGPVEFLLERLYLYNIAEKHRLGFGLQTTDVLWDKARVGAWAGYGTGDQKLKYAFWAETYLWRKDWRLSYEYADDLRPTGREIAGAEVFRPLYDRPQIPFHPRLLYSPYFDYQRTHAASLSFAIHRSFSGRATGRFRVVTPAFAFVYPEMDSVALKPTFRVAEAGLALRWAPKKTPMVLEAEVEKSFLGPYDYTFFSAAFHRRFRFSRTWRAESWARLHWTMARHALPLSFSTLLPAAGPPVLGADPYALNALPVNVFGRVQTAERVVVAGFALRWGMERRWLPDVIWRAAVGAGGVRGSFRARWHAETGCAVVKIFPPPLADRIGFGAYVGFGAAGWNVSYKIEVDL